MSAPFVINGNYASDVDYYVILGVDLHANQETIASAYKKLAKRFHPDKNNQDDRSRREAQYIFDKIKTAYDVLSDPKKRAIYDTLGPDGLKISGWAMSSKYVTADDIKEEFKRLQKQEDTRELILVAKPRASFSMSIDASDIFRSSSNHRNLHIDDMIEEEEEDDDDDVAISFFDNLPNIEIGKMAANMSVDHYIVKDHELNLSGGLNVRNGTGDGIVGFDYRYKYSPQTRLDLLGQFGSRPLLSLGLSHQLNKKTTFGARGFIVFIDSQSVSPGLKLSLNHNIRDNLSGKLIYKEGIDSSVSSMLVYVSQRLSLDLTISHKLSHSNQKIGMQLGYSFNRKRSKLSIGVGASDDGGLEAEYGCETQVLEINTIGAALALNVPDGVTLKIRYVRANQEFYLPIFLSDEINSAPIFYGTMVPLVAFYLWDKVYLRHYKNNK